MGMFKTGSTVALIFECPQDYCITRKEGERVKVGDMLLDRRVK